ncbi:hypothetical protein PHYPSEUDO_011516 [Phytophthora pseudosyringae]|uniref:Uncharacterized protein n=1 Tax=Phytophthora pseudosyringae TaxID=221518 RepID=A0A8T1VB86_9STRA|nr:hypothetical protein PHYPSEUDO_011516 [Phytophthora pseudosyringae]
MAGDSDDAVYASILARVERPELRDQLRKVARKECRSIDRQMRLVSASLAALRQLQAASQHLRPSGDWLPNTLQTQLTSLEELQRRLERSMDHLEMDVSSRRTKKRKRPVDKGEKDSKEDKKIVVADEAKQPLHKRKGDATDELDKAYKGTALESERLEEEEPDAEFVGVVHPGERRTQVEEEVEAAGEDKGVGAVNTREAADLRVEGSIQEQQQEGESDVENFQVVTADARRMEVEGGSQTESGAADSLSGSDELPRGLVRMTRDATVRIKEESGTVPDEQPEFDREGSSQVDAMHEADEIAEFPIELEVLESSEESSVEPEMSDSEESAIELDVPDSDSEDDFSPCVEMAAKLQNASAADQLVGFPAVVEQLRAYLLDRKHLTVTELDGYLFAHKRITDEEADEIGRVIETIIGVSVVLPVRPKIKLALYDLLAVVEQLECTLGGLPTFLCPAVKKFSSYFLSHVDEHVDHANREPRFAVLHL